MYATLEADVVKVVREIGEWRASCHAMAASKTQEVMG